MNIKLPDSLPKSEIIQNNELDIYQKCYQLFKKYIMENAYFCINISYDTRNAFYKNFGVQYSNNFKLNNQHDMVQYLRTNFKEFEIHRLFNRVLYEVYELIKIANDRFQNIHKKP